MGRFLRIAALTFLALPALAQTWFPADALPNEAARSYVRFFQAMHEPSLFELASRDPGAVAYRLLWLRDNDRPVAIRFALRPGGTAWFYRRVTGGTGLSAPTGALRDSGMSFSFKSRTASFLRIVEDVGFWNLPKSSSPSGIACRSHWVLEGARQGKYRVIDECSPGANQPARVIGMLAIRLGSLRVYGKNVY